MHFSSLAAATLAFNGMVSATPILSKIGLHNAIVARGRQFFGTALTIRDVSASAPAINRIERAIINNHADFGSVTPENAMKWESTEPSRGQFTFAGGDAIVEYAKQQKKQIHCHTLVWHSQLPAWVSGGGFDNQTLISIIEEHIKGVAGRWKGKCDRWDVVNEALNEDGTYRESVFYKTIGEAYLPIAFRLAAKYDPTAKLYYNDYNLEYNNAKTLGAQRILKLIQSYGVKIHGIGLQGHLVSEPTPTQDTPTPSQETLEKSLKTFTSLGVDVAYTEIDIRLLTPPTSESLAVQAKAYKRVVGSCLAVKRCVGITVWGVSDQFSWIPGVFEGEGAALLWDEEGKKKPGYWATLGALALSGWW